MCRSDRPALPTRRAGEGALPSDVHHSPGQERATHTTTGAGKASPGPRDRTFHLDDARPELQCTPGAPNDGSGSQGNSGYPLDDEDIAGSGSGAPHRGCLASPA